MNEHFWVWLDMPVIQVSILVDNSELESLQYYCRQKSLSVKALHVDISDCDFVLAEYWYLYLSRKQGNKKSSQKIKMPVSVARILWRYYLTETINVELQSILKQLDFKLLNLNLRPPKPQIYEQESLQELRPTTLATHDA